LNSTLALISGLGLGLGLETSGLGLGLGLETSGLGLGLEALGLGLETPGLVNIPANTPIETMHICGMKVMSMSAGSDTSDIVVLLYTDEINFANSTR